eukprot:1928640-Rhodomonas_salina.1
MSVSCLIQEKEEVCSAGGVWEGGREGEREGLEQVTSAQFRKTNDDNIKTKRFGWSCYAPLSEPDEGRFGGRHLQELHMSYDDAGTWQLAPIQKQGPASSFPLSFPPSPALSWSAPTRCLSPRLCRCRRRTVKEKSGRVSVERAGRELTGRGWGAQCTWSTRRCTCPCASPLRPAPTSSRPGPSTGTSPPGFGPS